MIAAIQCFAPCFLVADLGRVEVVPSNVGHLRKLLPERANIDPVELTIARLSASSLRTSGLSSKSARATLKSLSTILNRAPAAHSGARRVAIGQLCLPRSLSLAVRRLQYVATRN